MLTGKSVQGKGHGALVSAQHSSVLRAHTADTASTLVSTHATLQTDR